MISIKASKIDKRLFLVFIDNMEREQFDKDYKINNELQVYCFTQYENAYLFGDVIELLGDLLINHNTLEFYLS